MTQAEDFAARFNALEYVSGGVLNAMNFFEELDQASVFKPSQVSEDLSAYTGFGKPAFSIFADAHIEGTYEFPDGSSMLVRRVEGTINREASVLNG